MKNIKNKKWISIWSGYWNIINVSDWGQYYLNGLKINNKAFLHSIIFIIKNGKITAWVEENDINDFSKQMVKKYVNNTAALKKMCDKLKTKTDELLIYMKKNKNNITPEIYWEYIKKIQNYYEPHVIIKYMINSVPEKKLKKILQITQKARIYAEPVFTETIKFDKQLAKQFSKNKKEEQIFLYQTKQELKQFFHSKKLKNHNALKQRKKFSALVFLQSKPMLLTGKKAQKLENDIINKKNESLTIKGQVAYPGKIKGIVKIVKNPKQIRTFNKNNVLVTEMTRPEYINLIKKSSAFITEAGGMLSHAAIVARELKKPCIIGTRIATKILKNGDKIEVDANNGIIKLLNKN